ncbi:MAG: 6-phosphogluconolactonase, partial [Legionellales bacterium RIFCSPHIGHO2_12_FULL_42_9]
TMPDSNELLVRTCLLQHNAAKTQLISLYSEHECLANAVALTNERIGALPQFDVVILGMGEDGHTASLFPDSEAIQTAMSDDINAVTFVEPRFAPYPRITLTKARLLNTRSIFIHLVGQKKRAVLQKALEGDDELLMPIRAFLNHPGVDSQVMWAES